MNTWIFEIDTPTGEAVLDVDALTLAAAEAEVRACYPDATGWHVSAPL